MDFDWLDTPLNLKLIAPREIEESFEDPFSLRLLPEAETSSGPSRYFCLGKTVAGEPVFSVFWTDGKKYRVLACRRMTPEETTFYERKNNEML